MEEIEKVFCETCEKYLRHFIISRNRLVPTMCGHCKLTQRNVEKVMICRHWKEKNIVDERAAAENSIMEKIDALTAYIKELKLILSRRD